MYTQADDGRGSENKPDRSGVQLRACLEEAQMQLAKAIYASGCPLSMVDNKLWAKFFKTLRPSFKIPSRDSISNNLLERVYQECSATVEPEEERQEPQDLE
ncbi:hypothetical protein GWK47_023743 [Chionoecetes opilio]|uniref:Uncharacterized protein n=1 Tax=Chionoecetes opilio TaxID=41210 RepID=A0A8J4XMQ9_CHIOP|nr:hypothetical protein GWK47_023743 [Chionoecetes opilio]